MASLEDIARELSKMRTIAQSKEYPKDLSQSYAECLLLEKYGRLPSMVDLKRDSKTRVTLIPKDEHGALTRVIAHNILPWRVYNSWLGADIFVFIRTGVPMQASTILGWITRDSLLKMYPRADYYEVDIPYLHPMPESFKFEEPEHHVTGDWNGIWADEAGAWECCTCGRLIPDPHTRAAAERACE